MRSASKLNLRLRFKPSTYEKRGDDFLYFCIPQSPFLRSFVSYLRKNCLINFHRRRNCWVPIFPDILAPKLYVKPITNCMLLYSYNMADVRKVGVYSRLYTLHFWLAQNFEYEGWGEPLK